VLYSSLPGHVCNILMMTGRPPLSPPASLAAYSRTFSSYRFSRVDCFYFRDSGIEFPQCYTLEKRSFFFSNVFPISFDLGASPYDFLFKNPRRGMSFFNPPFVLIDPLPPTAFITRPVVFTGSILATNQRSFLFLPFMQNCWRCLYPYTLAFFPAPF